MTIKPIRYPCRRSWPGSWLPGLLAGLLLGMAGRGLALDPSRDITQYNCQTWNRQNGLLVNTVNQVQQTEDGYLWLGTAAGLIRFDGSTFTPMQGGRIVNSLENARKSGLWAALNNQTLNYYNRLGVLEPDKIPRHMPALNCLALHQDPDGTLWMVADTQLGRVTPAGAYEKLADLPGDQVLSGYKDAEGRLWYGTASHGLFYWQAGQIHQLADSAVDQALIFAIIEDHEGNLWIGTGGGLLAFDRHLKRKSIPPLASEVRALLVDAHGVLWIGTSQQGLARFYHGQYDFLHRSDGLASNYIRALEEDQEGSLWIGTRNGLNQLSDVKFPVYPASENPAVLDALSVYPARAGGVWVGSTVGLTYLNGVPKTYGLETGLSSQLVKRVLETTNGDLYLICGDRDLDIFSKGKVMASFTATNLLAGMVEDAHGVVASVGGELDRVGPHGFSPYEFTNGVAPAFWWILDLAPGGDGVTWVACANGIVRIKEGTFQQWTTAQGLSDNRVYWVCEDPQGVVWGAMATGIACLKDNQIRCLSETNGLFDNMIYCVVPDEQGNLWVDSRRGIFRVSQPSLEAWMAGRTNAVECTVYDGSGSVKQADRTFQEDVGCRSRDGRIWFPSAIGVVAIDPRHIPMNPVSPPVHLESIRANGRDYPLGSALVVPPGPGELQFSFTGLSFISPSKVRYRYQLQGFDQHWVAAGSRRQAYYTNLKPGPYTFQVQAANADGVWNQTGDAVEIELRPHFYETAWFFSGGVGLLLGGLALAIRGQRRRRAQQQRGVRAAQDRLEQEVSQRTSELAYERQLLRSLLENAPDHIYFKDRQSRFITNSNFQARQFGVDSPTDLAGKTDFDIFTEAHARPAYEEEQEIIRTGQPLIAKIERECWLNGRPDSWVLTTKMPLRNQQGEIIGTFGISKDITNIIEAEAKLKEVHRQLLEISRQAGMAEVATSVLHNVGNVLNSVNVSAALVLDNLKKSKITWVGRLADLLAKHPADLVEFLTNDPQGRQIPGFINELAGQLAQEQANALQELNLLRQNIDHIKDIVARQQNYAKISGVSEVVRVRDLVEDAVTMNAQALIRHGITVVRDYHEVPAITVEKHKVLQILVNLIRNAKYACDESGRTDKKLTLHIGRTEHGVAITVLDNGIGITPENLPRIFNHGFTTRKGGHGFGLHSGALAARELGGALSAHSEGTGRGATFTLTIPLQPGANKE